MRRTLTYAWLCCCVALLIQLPLAATADAGVRAGAIRARDSTVAGLPSELWAVQIGGAAGRLARPEVHMLRSPGVNTLLDGRDLGTRERAAVRGRARRAASRFVAGTGSDSNPCTRRAPCASFNRAYKLAKPGQAVEVAGGRYPSQVINPDDSKTSPSDVVFRPAPGARVEVGHYGDLSTGLTIAGADHLTIKGIKTGWLAVSYDLPSCCSVGPGTHFSKDVTFDGMTANAFSDSSGQHVTLENSNIGNYSVSDTGNIGTPVRVGSVVSSSQYRAPTLQYLAFKNNYVHNLVHPPGVTQHTACFYFASYVAHITITGNKFAHCAVIDLELGPSHDVTVENNWFDLPTLSNNACCSLQTIALDTGPGNPSTVLSKVRIAYNSFKGRITTNADTYHNVVVEHNVWEKPPGCFYGGNNGVTYSRNIMGGVARTKCASTDILAPTGWPNDSGPYSNAAFDFHLKRRAAAIDAGDRHGAPRRDIDGHRRPFGRAPDAGADEWTK